MLLCCVQKDGSDGHHTLAQWLRTIHTKHDSADVLSAQRLTQQMSLLNNVDNHASGLVIDGCAFKIEGSDLKLAGVIRNQRK